MVIFKKNISKKNYIIICLSIILSAIFITYGRYIYNDIKDLYLASKSFYFNSDKLTTNRAIYQVDNWSAVDPYSISINLNNSKNNLVRSNSDISYVISYICSSNIECSVSSEEGILLTTENTDNFTAVLTPKGSFEDGDEAWIEIKVNSTSPYKKMLSGRFILKVGKIGLSYSIDDENNRPYFDFRITNSLDYYIVKEAIDGYDVGARIDKFTYMNLSNADKYKCTSALITLDFNPSDVILDMTSNAYLNAQSVETINIDGYNYVNKISFKMDSESSDTVRFYKADSSKDYTYPFTNTSSVVNFSYSQ